MTLCAAPDFDCWSPK